MFRNLFFCLMAIVVIGGCSDTSNLITPNQIDTILSTCDTDIDIDIVNGNYTGSFDINKTCVDNVFLTTNRVGDTTEPVTMKGSLVQKVSVSQIVDDTRNDKNSYQGSLVLVSGKVIWVDDEKDALVLETNINTILFVLHAPGDEIQFKESYIEGQTYDFVVYVLWQRKEHDSINFSHIIWSYLVVDGDNIRNVSMNQLVSDTKQGGTSYQGSVVSFNAEIRSVLAATGTLTLVTNDDNVSFFLDPSGYFGEGRFKNIYLVGSSYDFILYIREQEQPDGTFDDWDIWSYIVE